jgi:hypothetical protein
MVDEPRPPDKPTPYTPSNMQPPSGDAHEQVFMEHTDKPIHVAGKDETGAVTDILLTTPSRVWAEIRQTGWAILFAVVIAVGLSSYLADRQVRAASHNSTVAAVMLEQKDHARAVASCERANEVTKERNATLNSIRNFLFLWQSAGRALSTNTGEPASAQKLYGQIASVSSALAGQVVGVGLENCAAIP